MKRRAWVGSHRGRRDPGGDGDGRWRWKALWSVVGIVAALRVRIAEDFVQMMSRATANGQSQTASQRARLVTRTRCAASGAGPDRAGQAGQEQRQWIRGAASVGAAIGGQGEKRVNGGPAEGVAGVVAVVAVVAWSSSFGLALVDRLPPRDFCPG